MRNRTFRIVDDRQSVLHLVVKFVKHGQTLFHLSCFTLLFHHEVELGSSELALDLGVLADE